jgi:hypothetical protein
MSHETTKNTMTCTIEALVGIVPYAPLKEVSEKRVCNNIPKPTAAKINIAIKTV